MDRYLKPGQVFTLADAGGTFEVREMIGRGASCVVYRTYFYDSNGIRTEHLLKEYNPKGVELSRDEAGMLHPGSPEAAERFQNGLAQFRDGFALQLRIRQEYPELTNSTSNIERIYTGNGTEYVSMPWFQGESYSKVRENDFCQLLRHIKAITKIVGYYHANGFLHLDIKPENIFLLPETAESVMLFDFDSVIRKADLSKSAGLSCTKTWAAPEQILPGHRAGICEATDLYAIGRILFYQLMGRHPVREECRSFSRYQYDSGSDLLKNVNPQVFPLLSEVLSHTICSDVSMRYQSAETLIERLDHLLPLADPKAPYLIGNLPAVLPSFVGRRREIAEIHQHLQKTGKLFLSGIGGIGKSELAKQYAHQFREAYDMVVFARCTDTLERLFADDRNLPIAHVSLYEEETLPQYSQRKKNFLRSLCTERTLLIVDNMNNVEDPLLAELLTMDCRVLITTRMDASAFGLPQMNVGALAVSGEIETMFQNACRRDLTEEEWPAVRELIRLVDCHTMAVELLAKQLRAAGVEPAELLERLKVHGISGSGNEKVCAGKDGDFSRQHAFAHISTLFDVAALSSQQQEILADLSLLPYTGIAKGRMREWCAWQDYETLNQLVEAGWVRDDPAGIISLHPLVAEVSMEYLRGAPQVCDTLLTNIRNYLESHWITLPPEQKQADAALIRDIGHNICRCGLPGQKVAFLLKRIALDLSGYGDPEDCIAFCRYALGCFENLYGTDSAQAAQGWNTLGKFYLDKGDYTATESCLMKALEIRKNLPERKPLDLAQSLANLGAVYLAQKRLPEAETYLKRGLKSYQKEIQTDHRGIAGVLENLGQLHLNIGNLSAAESYYLKSLHMYERLSGENHPDVARAIRGLAKVYLKNRDWERAKKAYERTDSIFQAVYGENHASVVSSQLGLGTVFECMMNLDQAETCYQKAIGILRNLYGENHPKTILTQNKLGAICESRGDYAQAEAIYLRVLKECRAIYGELSSHTADTLLDLGRLRQKRGDPAGAEDYLNQCRRIFETLYAGLRHGHPDLARIYQNLGDLKKERGDFAAAAEYFKKALEIRQRLYGEAHPITAGTLEKLGTLLYAQGDVCAARKKWEKVLEIRRSQCGEDHPDMARILQKIGRMHYENGELDAADECFRKVHRIYSKLDTGPSGRLAGILMDLGHVQRWRGEYDAALSYYRQAYEMCFSLYGADSRFAASALNCLAIGQMKKGDLPAAKETFRQVLTIYEKIYGKDAQDLHIAAVLHNLGLLYEAQKDYAQAKSCHKRALDIRQALLGDDHQDTASSWGHYGLACGRLGDFTCGVACCKKELSILRGLMGKDHIRTASALYRMGCLYADWEKYRQAEDAILKSLHIWQEKLGDAHPDTIRAKEKLENVHTLRILQDLEDQGY